MYFAGSVRKMHAHLSSRLRGVVKILGAGRELTPVPDIEIDNVRAVLDQKIDATPVVTGRSATEFALSLAR